eukprot:c26318_g1_i1.p1 GENE.c26318_g1_i1~~c26318_g1_i1.p1  ORF type:complete len:173 (+),score=27.01 c26318_g1_i1:42-560(+)
MSKRGKIGVLASAGLLVSLYALHVENQLVANPLFEPRCNTSWGSCSTVLSSSYAHPLSHWGVVSKNGPFDISLALAGIAVYLVFLSYATLPSLWRLVFRNPKLMLFLLSLSTVVFSAYLIYVLKVILKDFCIVCASFHVINILMFLFGALPELMNSRKQNQLPRSEKKTKST